MPGSIPRVLVLTEAKLKASITEYLKQLVYYTVNKSIHAITTGYLAVNWLSINIYVAVSLRVLLLLDIVCLFKTSLIKWFKFMIS